MLVDISYYLDEYEGTIIEDEDELDIMIKRSIDIIDSFLNHSLFYFDELDPYFQFIIKNAICMQADFLYVNGGLEFLAEESTAISMRVGNYTIVNGNGFSQRSKTHNNKFKYTSEQAINLLKSAGLISRSVNFF